MTTIIDLLDEIIYIEDCEITNSKKIESVINIAIAIKGRIGV